MPEYKDMYNSAPIGLWRTDLNTGEWLSANDATLKILGYSSFSELSQFRSVDLYSDINVRHKLIEQLKEVKEIDELEVILKRKDSKEIVVALSAKINFAKNCIEGSIRDITNIVAKESLKLIPYLEKISILKRHIMEKIQEADCLEVPQLRKFAKIA